MVNFFRTKWNFKKILFVSEENFVSFFLLTANYFFASEIILNHFICIENKNLLPILIKK